MLGAGVNASLVVHFDRSKLQLANVTNTFLNAICQNGVKMSSTLVVPSRRGSHKPCVSQKRFSHTPIHDLQAHWHNLVDCWPICHLVNIGDL